MNGKLLIGILALLATLFVAIDAHGRLLSPPSRSSAWRFGLFKGVFPESEFDTDWCDDLDQPGVNNKNVTCGVCGPIYNKNPGAQWTIVTRGTEQDVVPVTSFERNSYWFKDLPSMVPYVVRTFNRGQSFDTVIEVNILNLNINKS